MPNSQQRTPIHYSRNKDKVEIDGDPGEVKPMIWFDLITSRLAWIILTIIVLIVLPKASFIPIVFKFIRNKLFLILLLAQVGHLLFFSG